MVVYTTVRFHDLTELSRCSTVNTLAIALHCMKHYINPTVLLSLVGLVGFLLLGLVSYIGTRPTVRQEISARAEGTNPVFTVTFTDPPSGTTYTEREYASATVTVDHTYPLKLVQFKLATGNYRNVCNFEEELPEYTCTYKVPYTGKRNTGSTAGYAMYVWVNDTMGNWGAQSLQLWSNPAR